MTACKLFNDEARVTTMALKNHSFANKMQGREKSHLVPMVAGDVEAHPAHHVTAWGSSRLVQNIQPEPISK